MALSLGALLLAAPGGETTPTATACTEVAVSVQPSFPAATARVVGAPEKAVQATGGQIKLCLAAGSHNIKVSADGYVDKVLTITLPGKTTHTVQLVAEPPPTTCRAAFTAPIGHDVYSGGAKLGTIPFQTELPLGNQNFKLVVQGKDVKSVEAVTVNVRRGTGDDCVRIDLK